MKTIVSLLLVTLVIGNAHAQGTLIHRIDMSCDSQPYHTTALILDNGWELWGFGDTKSESLDLELGRLFPVAKNLLVGGYGVYWPASKKSFVAPAVSYSQKMFGGQLSAFATLLVPLDGGPRILLADDISWTKQQTRRLGFGLAANYYQFDRDPVTLRLGPTVKLQIGDTAIKINYQPWYPVGRGNSVLRLELSRQF